MNPHLSVIPNRMRRSIPAHVPGVAALSCTPARHASAPGVVALAVSIPVGKRRRTAKAVRSEGSDVMSAIAGGSV